MIVLESQILKRTADGRRANPEVRDSHRVAPRAEVVRCHEDLPLAAGKVGKGNEAGCAGADARDIARTQGRVEDGQTGRWGGRTGGSAIVTESELVAACRSRRRPDQERQRGDP